MSAAGMSTISRELVVPRDLVTAAARRFADRPALMTFDRTWTFAEIDERSTRLANTLLGLGIRPSDPVATMRWNIPEHIEIQLAMFKLGTAMVNINPRLSADEMVWQLNHSMARVVIAAPEFEEFLTERRADLEHVRDILIVRSTSTSGKHRDYEQALAEGSPSAIDVAVSADDYAYIRYTSGTTGLPKGVLHDQHTLVAVTRNLLLDYVPDLSQDDVLLALQGLYHGAGWFILPCWVRGAAFVVVKDFDAGTARRAIERFDVSIIKSVPTVIGRLVSAPELDRTALGRVRTVVYGGSPMPRAVIEHGMKRWGNVFVQLYGQAESPMTITVLDQNDHAAGLFEATGRAVTLAEVRIVDDGRELAAGEVGEVVVRGDHNMRGYWRDEAATDNASVDGWVYTGDLGRCDERGYLYLVDRRGEMIVSGGLNVYPHEVEQVLYDHPDVLEVAVVGAPDDQWGERVAAFVSARDGHVLDIAALEQHCAAHLARFKQPREFHVLDELPKNAAGKIMRKAVREPLWSGHERRIH